MQWGGLALLLFVAYVAQGSLTWLFGPTLLDPFLILTLGLALVRPNYEARLSGWCVGLVQDLGSADPLGVHAFTLGLTALLATELRRVLNANVWWSRGLILFGAAWPAEIVLRTFLRFRLGTSEPLGDLLWQATLIAVFAVVLVMTFFAIPSVAAWRRRVRRAEGAY